MVTYIRNNVLGYYVEFPEEIDAEYWAGKIGSTYEDFINGKWIKLSDEQLAFHVEYPNASIELVLAMEISGLNRTLEEAKLEKLYLIELYDRSDNVNGFDIILGENTITTWITPDLRSNYKNSLDSAELLGLEEVHPVFNGIQLTLSTQMAKMALALILIYADRCYIVTETHKANVNALDSIESVDNYNNETGYPEKLVFNLNS